jgi:hypothetical protein
MLHYILLLEFLCFITATPPRVVSVKSKTLRLKKIASCPSTTTSTSCIDLLTVSFDQPLYIHGTPQPAVSEQSPTPISDSAVQRMLDRNTISFHGNPAYCVSWRTYEEDRRSRRSSSSKVVTDATTEDIDHVLHQQSNDHGARQHNVMRFIQRTPCAEEAVVPRVKCHVRINDTSLRTYHGTRTSFIDFDQSFQMREHVENVFSFNIDSAHVHGSHSSHGSYDSHRRTSKDDNGDDGDDGDDGGGDGDNPNEINITWGGSCKVPLASASKRRVDQHLNLTSLALLETKDRMAIMTRVFKGLVSDVIDGTVAGAAGPMLEQTEERAGEADTDDMRGKIETSLDGTAPIKISQMLEASLTYNLTGLLTDAVTAALSPRLASTMLDNVGSAVARVVVDELPDLVSTDIAAMLTATIGERLDGSLPDLLRRSLGPRLVDILTRSLTHSLVPSLSKSLTHNSRQRYWCWACFVHKQYCRLCHDSPTSTYYQNYYDAFYSDFFSDYYGTYYSEAARNLDAMQHPRGKDSHNPRCGSGSGQVKCKKSPSEK